MGRKAPGTAGATSTHLRTLLETAAVMLLPSALLEVPFSMVLEPDHGYLHECGRRCATAHSRAERADLHEPIGTYDDYGWVKGVPAIPPIMSPG